MLNSNRDKSIKRYLSKIGKLKISSKLYSSRYYEIPELKLVVRFSDHFNDRTSQLEIVKINQYYTIKTDFGFSLTCLEEHVLIYLKSLLLLYPELSSSVGTLRKAAQRATNELNKLKSQISEQDIQQIKLLNNQISSLQNKCDSLASKNDSLENKCNSLASKNSSLEKQNEVIRKKLVKTRNALKEVIKDL